MPTQAHHKLTASQGQQRQENNPTPASPHTDLHEDDTTTNTTTNTSEDNNSNASDDDNSLQVDSSWQQQPVRLPAYTPSSAAKETGGDSPATSLVDDPIYLAGSNKHFGFSSRQSRASSIFPWRKHKPAVSHQYAPHRPPLSKRSSSLAGLKVMPVANADPVKHMDDEELDLLALKGDKLARRVLELLHLMDVEDWPEVQDYHQLKLDRISGAMTNCVFLVSGPPRSQPAVSSQEEQGSPAPATPALTSDPPRPRKILLRVYGNGLDALFSREKELHWLENLSTMDIGPSLLGIFKNGRFEQYVESTTLTKDDIRNPRTSRHIAHRMCELHNIVNVFPPPEGTIPQSQENIARWIPLAKDAIEKICARDPSKRAVIDDFDFDKLITEIEEVHRELMAVHSPIVFAHNDAQYGNILKSLDEDGELVVIDFEYAGYNTRGFDIGNHFCEWTADYHSERPSILHHDRYPTKAEQLNFLEAYMEAEIAMCGYHLTAINLAQYTKNRRRRSVAKAIVHGLSAVALSAIHAKKSLAKKPSVDLKAEDVSATNSTEQQTDTSNNSKESTPPPPSTPSTPLTPTSTTSSKMSGVKGSRGNSAIENEIVNPIKKDQGGNGSAGVSKAEILDSMYKEVNKFALTSHIMWGLWGLIQATQSEIEFDYLEYALQRLCEFRRRRDEFMSL
ncbi:hypothetical protein EC957_011357 [Mortierella hygrophila]|uniref:Choline kinase n=1 Tax=Mortierella hygrophila TaxID=979708 RepID=A0A9P6FHP8_9FUNG|nr:hypothetical protein EC957_011357 [Mortierella hygrophila]